MGLGIFKEALFSQCGFQLSEIAVHIGCNIVFHRNCSIISFSRVSSCGMKRSKSCCSADPDGQADPAGGCCRNHPVPGKRPSRNAYRASAESIRWACNLILVYRETVGSAPINNSCYFRKSGMISDKDSHLFGWLSFFEMDARRADKLLHERLVRL